MGFALQDTALESYADSTSTKLEMYTISKKYPAALELPLFKEKIEKQQTQFDKWNLNKLRICDKISKMYLKAI